MTAANAVRSPLSAEYKANAARWERVKPPVRATHNATPTTKATRKATNMATTNTIRQLSQRIDALGRQREFAAIDALLAKHSNLPADFVKHCRTRSLADAKAMIAAVTLRSAHDPERGPALTAREQEFLDRGMGLGPGSRAVGPMRTPDGRPAFSHAAMQRQARGEKRRP